MRPPWSCWTTPTTSSAPLSALCLLALAACGPTAPEGVDQARLDAEISQAIGDPATCVLLAEAPGGKVVYRYNSNTACDRKLPACDVAGERTIAELVKQTAADGQIRALSCNTTTDASRGVAWASGPVPGRAGLAYAAMMEGDRAFPGRMMADRLARAFRDAGLTPAS